MNLIRKIALMYLCVLDMQRRRGGQTRTAESSRAGLVEEDLNTTTEDVNLTAGDVLRPPDGRKQFQRDTQTGLVILINDY